MDENIFYLAILALGTFVGVLVTTIIYYYTVRPQLLEPVAIDERFHQALSTQHEMMMNLQHGLENNTQRLYGYLATLEEQRNEQRSFQRDFKETVSTELRAISFDQTGIPSTPTRQQSVTDSELETLLAEHRVLLNTVRDLLGENQRKPHIQLRGLGRQLTTNGVMLQRLITMMQDLPVAVPQVPQPEPNVSVDEFQNQLKDLAGLVQELAQQKAGPPIQDRLTDIKGIGPVYSGILHEAGIHTFDQLANMTAPEIDILINAPDWRKMNTQDWIEQARLRASQRRKLENQS